MAPDLHVFLKTLERLSNIELLLHLKNCLIAASYRLISRWTNLKFAKQIERTQMKARLTIASLEKIAPVSSLALEREYLLASAVFTEYCIPQRLPFYCKHTVLYERYWIASITCKLLCLKSIRLIFMTLVANSKQRRASAAVYQNNNRCCNLQVNLNSAKHCIAL